MWRKCKHGIEQGAGNYILNLVYYNHPPIIVQTTYVKAFCWNQGYNNNNNDNNSNNKNNKK